MKKFELIMLIVFIGFIGYAGINSIPFTKYKELPPITSSAKIEDIPKDNEANAYFEIFKNLNIQENSEDYDKYLALDLSNVIYDDASNLTALFLDYCDKNGYTLLMDTFDGVVEKGYILDRYFETGITISFRDKDIENEKRLVISVMECHGIYPSFSATYTVELIDGEWQIKKIDDICIID